MVVFIVGVWLVLGWIIGWCMVMIFFFSCMCMWLNGMLVDSDFFVFSLVKCGFLCS